MTSIHVEQKLIAYCSRSERCISDVKTKMFQWKIPLFKQEKIILNLQKENFLNEQRYCQSFVHYRTQLSHLQSIRKIRYELEQKKIQKIFIEQALSQVNSQEMCKHLAKLLEKKRISIKKNFNSDIYQKLVRFAYQKGFSIEDIETAFKILSIYPMDYFTL